MRKWPSVHFAQVRSLESQTTNTQAQGMMPQRLSEAMNRGTAAALESVPNKSGGQPARLLKILRAKQSEKRMRQGASHVASK